MTQQYFISKAIDLANENLKKGGEAYGAIVVKDGQIIGSGVNEMTLRNDPTAHAELIAIQEAAKKLKNPNLEGCEIYASGEPCPMCLAAIYWANIKTVFFHESCSSPSQFIYEEIAKPPKDRSIMIKQLEK